MTINRHQSSRASNLPSPRPVHDIVEMKQYQQNYNSTAGPNAVKTLIKNQKSKKDCHSEEPVHVTRVHSRDTTFQPLPLSVINRVKIYVFFIGVARSRHSIVGAILDSHPHIVISNELNVFRSLLNLPDTTKSMLYNKIWNAVYVKTVEGENFRG